MPAPSQNGACYVCLRGPHSLLYGSFPAYAGLISSILQAGGESQGRRAQIPGIRILPHTESLGALSLVARVGDPCPPLPRASLRPADPLTPPSWEA